MDHLEGATKKEFIASSTKRRINMRQLAHRKKQNQSRNLPSKLIYIEGTSILAKLQELHNVILQIRHHLTLPGCDLLRTCDLDAVHFPCQVEEGLM
jgi:hypothetical protein